MIFCKRVKSNVLNKKTIESLVKSGTFDSLGRSRKFLLENFEKIIEETLKIRRDKEKGQFSLFGNGNGSEDFLVINGAANSEDNNDEFPQKKLLNFEKEMLGLYISGHPLAEYENILAGLTPISKLPDIEDKATVSIGGIITNIKNIYTKREQQMCFIDFEDIENNLEVIVFPTVLEKYREFIVEDRIIKMKGKIDKKEDQIKLLANEFSELKKDDLNIADKERKISETRENKITFRIRKKDMDIELINHFYRVLKDNPGECMVEFKIVNENDHKLERTYNLPEDYKVKPGDKLFSEIKKDFAGKVLSE